MGDRVTNFFKKKQIQPEYLIYLLREDGKTVLHFMDSHTLSTRIPLKEILAQLPEEDFLNIQKGVAVSAAQIADISAEGIYTMSDGRTFQGRRRNPKEHQTHRRSLHLDGYVPVSEIEKLTLPEKCTVLDNGPIAVCLIELQFAPDGAICDLVFRYVNEQMAEFEGLPVERLTGLSINSLYKNLDPKKLIAYADVALNGTNRVFRARGLVSDEPLIICCHQPAQGFCMCSLIREADVLQTLQPD